MGPMFDLVSLQSVDLEIDRLERSKVNLPELGELRRLHDHRREVESQHGENTRELGTLDLQFDKTNGELQIMEERLRIAEKRLFGGGMSSKETENRRLEVESLGARIDRQESEALDLMERREQVAGRVEELSTQLGEARRREGEVGAVVRKAWGEMDVELAELRAERARLVAPVPPRVMEVYESLRRDKGGLAAGRLEGNTCGGCRLALSESERQEAGESDPPRCPHCRRFLVF